MKVIVDPSWPKNKPRALNAALPHCTGTITGVFDAEDIVHPALLRRIDQTFQRTEADVVQAGVQLMNFRSSWLTVRNVLEYYFWFRSRLHVHARQGFIPLGGNTVFVRTKILRAVSGWDPECLAEDCELGVRLSSLGAHTVVVYEPEMVTREECPPTLRAFARQRTRWSQGYLQTLSRGYWRRLPRRQRALGAYILAMPYLMALAWLMIPAALATAIALKAPVPITLISFLPALPILSILAVELAGLGQFCQLYGERASARDYARLVFGLPLYQAVLAFASARAVVREARGDRGWEKTAHHGLHLVQPAEGAVAPAAASSRAGTGRFPAVRPRRRGAPRRACCGAGQRAARGPPGRRTGVPFDRRDQRRGPLWMRLEAVSADGSGLLSLPTIAPSALPASSGPASRRACPTSKAGQVACRPCGAASAARGRGARPGDEHPPLARNLVRRGNLRRQRMGGPGARSARLLHLHLRSPSAGLADDLHLDLGGRDLRAHDLLGGRRPGVHQRGHHRQLRSGLHPRPPDRD